MRHVSVMAPSSRDIYLCDPVRRCAGKPGLRAAFSRQPTPLLAQVWHMVQHCAQWKEYPTMLTFWDIKNHPLKPLSPVVNPSPVNPQHVNMSIIDAGESLQAKGMVECLPAGAHSSRQAHTPQTLRFAAGCSQVRRQRKSALLHSSNTSDLPIHALILCISDFGARLRMAPWVKSKVASRGPFEHFGMNEAFC